VTSWLWVKGLHPAELFRREEGRSMSKENEDNQMVTALAWREGRSLWLAADLYTAKAGSEDTGGR
jgi:hypothetical protein